MDRLMALPTALSMDRLMALLMALSKDTKTDWQMDLR